MEIFFGIMFLIVLVVQSIILQDMKILRNRVYELEKVFGVPPADKH